TSHSEDLGKITLRSIRSIYQRYGSELGVSMVTEQADYLHFSNDSVIRAAPVNGKVAGFGYHWIIVDDAYGKQTEAMNPDHRAKIWDWFNAELMTRRNSESAAVVAILSRRHPSDLTGQLLQENKTLPEIDKWHYLNFPA